MTISTLTATRWALDARTSTVEFSVRQLWGLSTVRGRFTRFAGELAIGPDGAGAAELRIEATSLETGNRRRDRHLRDTDYFDCDRHPLVRYVAAVAPALAPDGLRLTGRLVAAGRATPLELVAVVEGGGDRLELSTGAALDARALGMTWSPAGTARTPVAIAVRARLQRKVVGQ
jgi:polyisoprenoid-binding protein YceI